MTIQVNKVLVLFCTLTGAALCADQQVMVSAPAGDIVGLVSNVNIEGRQYTIKRFLGVPYAESPTGDRRFRKPVPKARFSSPYQAFQMRNFCYQSIVSFLGAPVADFTEDCLILNIYVPATSQSTQLPVMVWIHGGGFTIGSSSTYPGNHLSSFGQVIVVTINYRLSAYGFLSTGDSNVPGNFGLWDQHLAIKWVHNNIQSFGGDKDLVTIFGESAGSASVVYQTLYPGNKGLFHRAIAQSGSALSSWASNMHPERSSEPFATAMGCTQSTWSEKLQCLRTKPISELNSTINDPTKNQNAGEMRWTPVVDGEFILEDPHLILSGGSRSVQAREMFGSVDFLTGSNNVDGAVTAVTWMTMTNVTDPDKVSISRDLYEKTFIPMYTSQYLYLENSTDIINKAVIMEYTDSQAPNDENIRLHLLANMTTDATFAVPDTQTVDAHALYSNKSSYIYEFGISPPFRILSLPSSLDGPNRSNHGDDVIFIFGFDPEMAIFWNNDNSTIKPQHRRASSAMMTMWTNFAKSGNPNQPEDSIQYTNTVWPEYDRQTRKCFEISPNMGPSSIRSYYKAKEMAFWTNFLPKLLNATTCPAHKPTVASFPGLVG